MKKYNKIKTKASTLLYPLPVAMVSCGNMEESNIITAAWTGIINSDPPMTYVSIKKERFSHHIIDENREFVINLVNEDLVKAMDFCGVKSGKLVDKFGAMSLTKVQADEVGAPMIAEAPISLECKVFEIKELPSHDMFMAEILAVHIAEDYIDEDGAYRLGEMGLVTLTHGSYYKIERRKLGFFGFSILKNKTKKKFGKKGPVRRG